MLASHTGTGLCYGCSTLYPAPWASSRWPKGWTSLTKWEIWKKLLAYSGQVSAFVAFRVNQWMEAWFFSFCFSLCLCLFQMNKINFKHFFWWHMFYHVKTRKSLKNSSMWWNKKMRLWDNEVREKWRAAEERWHDHKVLFEVMIATITQ